MPERKTMLILKEQYNTEIWVSDQGYLCLKQAGIGGDINTIYLSADQASQMSFHLPDFLAEARENWTNYTEDDHV
jgi:hypothetical protein